MTRQRGIPDFYRLAVPCFFYFLIFYILPPPLPLHADRGLLDPSWHVILTQAFLNGTHFGRDLIYTYGPWGFVENPRGDPRIYPWLVAARLVIGLAFAGGASLILERTVRRPVFQLGLLAWIAVFSNPLSVLPVLLLGVVSLSEHERDPKAAAIVHLLAIACALDVWIKFTSFVLVGALVAVLAVQDLMRRRWPALSAEICGAALAFWLLARQPVYGIADFLHGAFSTASSYSAAMFIPGPYRESGFVGALLAALAIASVPAFRRRASWSILPAVAWVALMFFLQLKEAFVRYDDFHVWMGIIDALQPCALIALCLIGCFGEMVRPVGSGCAVCVVVLSVVLTGMTTPSMAGLEHYQIATENLAGLKSLLSGRSLGAAYREQLAEFHREAPLDGVSGSAAFFPDDQLLLLGNGLPVRLPPVPQSFAAYNEYLSGRNAAFFRGPRRPDYVFFDISPIDRRYPTAADNLSWLALYDCYRPAGYASRVLVLRAAGCQASSMELMAKNTVRSGDRVSVPAVDEPVWVVIDVRLTRRGTMVAALARPPVIGLAVETGEGRHVYSLPIESGRMGFLLSPMLRDAGSFGRLVADGVTDRASLVHSIAVISNEAGALLEPAIGVQLYRVRGARGLSAHR